MNSTAYNKIFYKHYCKKNKTNLKEISSKLGNEPLEKTVKLKVGGELYKILKELGNFSTSSMSETIRETLKNEIQGTLKGLQLLETIEKNTNETLYGIIDLGVDGKDRELGEGEGLIETGTEGIY